MYKGTSATFKMSSLYILAHACHNTTLIQVRANRHRGLSPRSTDLAKEDRTEVEAEGAARRGPRLLWRGQEYQGVASQGQEETVNRFFLVFAHILYFSFMRADIQCIFVSKLLFEILPLCDIL